MNKLLQFYQQHRFIRWFWWLLIVIPGVPFILITVGFLFFAHWPRDYQALVNIDYEQGIEYFTLSAHGVKDTRESWSNTLQNTLADVSGLSFSSVAKQHHSLAWQPYSDNVLICSVAGKNIGQRIGEHLAQLPKLQAVHLIGHSCGAFVIFGICQTLKQANPSLKVHTTYLDPVSLYSGLSWDYGLNNFGSCADFSDAYIDTHDTIPGSNQALPHAYTFDVSQLRITRNLGHPPHIWPTLFYIEALKKKQVPIYFRSTPGFAGQFQKNTLNIWPIDKS